MPYQENFLIHSVPDDLVIWRYMDLPKFLLMLELRSLYFAVISEFEDKWEAVISRDLSRGIQTMAGAASGTMIQSFQEAYEHLGINCWYSGVDESIAMWRLYTSTEYGLAIKSTVARLKQSMSKTKETVVIGKVDYRDHTDPPSTTLVETDVVSPFTALLQKRTCYKHECEIRAITQVFPHGFDTERISNAIDCSRAAPKHGASVQVELQSLIESITRGPNFPKWADALLDSALLRARLNVPVVESNAFKEPEARYYEP